MGLFELQKVKTPQQYWFYTSTTWWSVSTSMCRPVMGTRKDSNFPSRFIVFIIVQGFVIYLAFICFIMQYLFPFNRLNATLFWHQQPRTYIYVPDVTCSDQVFIMWTTNGVYILLKRRYFATKQNTPQQPAAFNRRISYV